MNRHQVRAQSGQRAVNENGEGAGAGVEPLDLILSGVGRHWEGKPEI